MLRSHRSEAPRAREESRSSEGREIRTPDLLIWSQTRCRCAIPPWARRKLTASVVGLAPLIGGGHRSEAPRAREESRSSEGREIRSPNLLVWSQTRCRCAIPPWARRKLTASVVELVPLIGGGHRSEAPRAREESSSSEGREIRTPNLLIWSQTRCRCSIPLGLGGS